MHHLNLLAIVAVVYGQASLWTVTTVAGNGVCSESDGQATSASFYRIAIGQNLIYIS